MKRFVFILFVVGLYLIGSAGYDLFVQAGTSREPTTISVAELQKNIPANRHLIVTGGRPVTATAVKFYRTQWGSKVSGSEILFIPIADASAVTAGSTPSILLRMTEGQLDAAKAGDKVNFKQIEGVRTTSMDLEGKARQRLVDTYGKEAVDRMIILNYHGKIGMGTAAAKLAGGVVIVGAMIAAFIWGRKSTPQPSLTPPLPTSAPPPLPR